ncbi:TPA: hypothetical protein ACP9FK_001722, partial [Legionella anisa]
LATPPVSRSMRATLLPHCLRVSQLGPVAGIRLVSFTVYPFSLAYQTHMKHIWVKTHMGQVLPFAFLYK